MTQGKDLPKILFAVHRADMKSAPKDKLKKGPQKVTIIDNFLSIN